MRLPPLCHVTGVLKITHSGLPWPSILKANWSLGSLGWPTSSHVLTESLQRSRPLWCYLSPLQPKANSSLVWDHISHEPSSWYSLLWCYGIFPMESPWRWSWITPCLTHWRCFLLDSNCSIPLLMTVDEEQLSNWKIPRNTRGFSFMQMVSNLPSSEISSVISHGPQQEGPTHCCRSISWRCQDPLGRLR